MKKLFVLSFLLPFALTTVKAQQTDGIKFGVTAGLNVSNLTDLNSKASFHAGIKAEKLITENVYIEGAILYSAKGAKLDFGDLGSNKINANYIEVPVHVGYKYNINPDLALMGSFGPYFAYGVGGKMKVTELELMFCNVLNFRLLFRK